MRWSPSFCVESLPDDGRGDAWDSWSPDCVVAQVVTVFHSR